MSDRNSVPSNAHKPCEVERKCAVCLQPFVVKNTLHGRSRWWCSDDCKEHAFDERTCPICETVFTPKRADQHFCKQSCGQRASVLYLKGVTREDLVIGRERDEDIEAAFQRAKQNRIASGRRFEPETWSHTAPVTMNTKKTREAICEHRDTPRSALL